MSDADGAHDASRSADAAPAPAHHPADPELIALLALEATSGLGPRRIHDLLGRYGSARAAVAATPEVRRRPASAEPSRARMEGARLVAVSDPAYPAPLAELPAPPPVLRVRGMLPRGVREGSVPAGALAIVGSRACTERAERHAFDLAREVARRGVTVVSGLALGIDAAAHRGALAAGAVARDGPGGTIAVLGSGVARVAPTRHVSLAEQILAAGGALVSEFPIDAPARPENFPRRNRLISALASAVVVVEAGERSGVFHTVDRALEQGRPVYVVPDHPTNPRARGGLRLLRDGAAPLVDVADLFGPGAPFPERRERAGDGAGPEPVRPPGGGTQRPAPSDPVDRTVVEALASHGPCSADALAASLARDRQSLGDAGPVPTATDLARRLARLELDGWIRRGSGGAYAAVR